MKIRRYMGNNAQEAILKVKMDLGAEAIILNTRKVKQKGFLKIFSKPLIEVLAAVDEDYGARKTRKQAPVNTVPGIEDAAGGRQISQAANESDIKIVELENKVSSMESLLNKILAGPAPQATASFPRTANHDGTNRIIQIMEENLFKNEVEPKWARLITDSIKSRIRNVSGVDEIVSSAYDAITHILGKPQPITPGNNGKPTVAIFVGPTGVGKTTTLAKIAANFTLSRKKNVGFITADTYRIAAIDQLKIYAEILGIPLSVVYTPADMMEAVAGFADKDIILIDTAGRSHKNVAQFEEIKALVKASGADEVFLVISSTTGLRNSREIIENYSFLGNVKLIFTKLDESPTCGIILNIRQMSGKSLSYITTGQSVPDDIEVANVDKIAKELLGSIVGNIK